MDTPLSVSAPGLLGNDFDADGDSLSWVSFSLPANGVVSGTSADGAFTYTPDPGFDGTDTFNYTIGDGTGSFATGSVTIAVVALNRAPVAVADSYVTDFDTPLSVSAPGLLGNDVDADGDPLSWISFSLPDNGIVSGASADGAFTYTPNPGFAGTDTFNYTIGDGTGSFATGTATVTVLPSFNREPVAVADGYTTDIDTSLSISAPGLLANDFDPDGDPLSWISFSLPANGIVSGASADGAFTYTPNPGFVGTDSFDYTIGDGAGSFTTGTVFIVVVGPDVGPVAVPDGYSTAEDTPLSVSAPGLLGNDFDPDGDPLSWISFSLPDNGVVSGASLDGAFTYTPDSGFVGTDTFNYTIGDGTGSFATGSVTIAVVALNRAPVAVADSYVTDFDTPLSVSAPGLLANDVDADGDSLSWVSFSLPANGVVSGASLDGAFTYTPNPGFAGTDTFSYTIGDGTGSFATGSATVTVLPSFNRAPVVVADSYVTDTDTPVTASAPGLLANDFDPDGDPLSWISFSLPANGIVSGASADGAFTYTPNPGFVGTDSFDYTIGDGAGSFATGTVFIVVADLNDPPVVDVTATAIDEGESTTLSVSFSDPDAGDTHSAVVDWGDGSSTTVDPATSPFSLSHAYGDDGTYTVNVTVTDADGATDTATASVVVTNLAPTVAIAGPDIVVGTLGGDTVLSATASDAGSDDLTVAWSPGASNTYFNDGVGPDGPSSPDGIFPFTVTDTQTVSFTSIGVSAVSVTATDDDGGSASDSATVVTLGDADAARSQGFWAHQYAGKGKVAYDDATLEAFLAITDVTSDVFAEDVSATTIEDADAVLGPSADSKAGTGNEVAELREKATAQLLAAWLNYAAGGVAWDEPIDTGVEGTGTAPFHEVTAEAEAILQDTGASHTDLERAKDLAEAINTHDGDD